MWAVYRQPDLHKRKPCSAHMHKLAKYNISKPSHCTGYVAVFPVGCRCVSRRSAGTRRGSRRSFRNPLVIHPILFLASTWTESISRHHNRLPECRHKNMSRRFRGAFSLVLHGMAHPHALPSLLTPLSPPDAASNTSMAGALSLDK